MSKQLVATDRKVANYQSLIDQLGPSYRYLLFDTDSYVVAPLPCYLAVNLQTTLAVAI
jgi:hypothetical protein